MRIGCCCCCCLAHHSGAACIRRRHARFSSEGRRDRQIIPSACHGHWSLAEAEQTASGDGHPVGLVAGGGTSPCSGAGSPRRGRAGQRLDAPCSLRPTRRCCRRCRGPSPPRRRRPSLPGSLRQGREYRVRVHHARLGGGPRVGRAGGDLAAQRHRQQAPHLAGVQVSAPEEVGKLRSSGLKSHVARRDDSQGLELSADRILAQHHGAREALRSHHHEDATVRGLCQGAQEGSLA
mmetsp:Transcript_15615/g.49141  ORF Transcript_15615/g.49141 Transcript_15615/m.49141 type:complete len:235 (+) Transcript_15615:171-875(+)